VPHSACAATRFLWNRSSPGYVYYLSRLRHHEAQQGRPPSSQPTGEGAVLSVMKKYIINCKQQKADTFTLQAVAEISV
jgi:hypothetical protein